MSRTLFIDFDLYTDGDEEFKQELIDSMIDNLVEMQQVLQEASQRNDAGLFQGVCHKIKPTLEMLADVELLDTVSKLKVNVTDPANITLLNRICKGIVQSLKNA
ncbi:hypothetical protein [Parachryseolinea silvisoli]|uniref:hypothetical protein n=1 Tax=Parachryseolinea silvisoli TaxID=2873601 RepID=UPI002265E1B0|nr:hypothetical protein [Parachryseolinea silvisoli]MCD9015691.1 hypothetical protein [Parachryseolinea silvisoli]